MVRLVPMTHEEFEAYLAVAIPEYARENVAAGYWSSERALDMAKESYDTLLPDGLRTEDHYLNTLVDDATGEKVGILWFALQKRGGAPRLFVFEIIVDEPYRRRGYATEALAALEERARELGAPRIMLHVFAHNHGARALYERLGFVPVSLNLSKTLSS